MKEIAVNYDKWVKTLDDDTIDFIRSRGLSMWEVYKMQKTEVLLNNCINLCKNILKDKDSKTTKTGEKQNGRKTITRKKGK